MAKVNCFDEILIQSTDQPGTDVLEKMCGLDISSTQVSRAAKVLDEQLEKWRRRPLGEYPYLVPDAHYEKVRKNGSVVSCAVFTAIGI